MNQRSSAFTTTELIVTLFIATMFFIAGNQIYLAVIQDSARTKREAAASSAAYNKLREVSNDSARITSPCTSWTPSAQSATVAGLTNVTYTVSVSCPYASSDAGRAAVSKVKVTYSYKGIDQQETSSYAILASPPR